MITDFTLSDFSLAEFHLLRPEWLLALIPLFLIASLLLRRKLFSRNWQSVIDPKLMPHVLIGKPGRQSYWPIFLLLWRSKHPAAGYFTQQTLAQFTTMNRLPG